MQILTFTFCLEQYERLLIKNKYFSGSFFFKLKKTLVHYTAYEGKI